MKTISFITVVFNDRANIGKTMNSIISLKALHNIQYIVIDGKSSDGTWDEVLKNKSYIDYCVSEKDSGIYNAMNKAIELIEGEWVIFINSGDLIVQNPFPIFEKKISEDVGIIYGDVYLTFKQGKVLLKATSKKGSVPSFTHQSAFIRSDLMKKWKYDEKYKICADYDFFKKVHDNGYKFLYCNYPISYYDMDGMSANNLQKYYQERISIGDKISKFSYIKFWIRSKIQMYFPALYARLLYNSYRIK